MLKIEIALKNPFFDPPGTGEALSQLLHEIADDIQGSVWGRGEVSRAIMLPRLSVMQPRECAGRWAIVQPSPVETRRDRLARLLIWVAIPGGAGRTRIATRVNMMFPGDSYITETALIDTDIDAGSFWAEALRLQNRVLDRVEAIADVLS